MFFCGMSVFTAVSEWAKTNPEDGDLFPQPSNHGAKDINCDSTLADEGARFNYLH